MAENVILLRGESNNAHLAIFEGPTEAGEREGKGRKGSREKGRKERDGRKHPE